MNPLPTALLVLAASAFLAVGCAPEDTSAPSDAPSLAAMTRLDADVSELVEQVNKQELPGGLTGLVDLLEAEGYVQSPAAESTPAGYTLLDNTLVVFIGYEGGVCSLEVEEPSPGQLKHEPLVACQSIQ